MSKPLIKERVLEDDYPIYADYFYVVDGKVIRSDFHGVTARDLRISFGAKEVRNCDVFGRGGFDACAAESAKNRRAA